MRDFCREEIENRIGRRSAQIFDSEIAEAHIFEYARYRDRAKRHDDASRNYTAEHTRIEGNHITAGGWMCDREFGCRGLRRAVCIDRTDDQRCRRPTE